MFDAVRAVHSVKLREQGTTVLMLDFPFQAEFAIAIAECPCKFRFQPGKTSALLPDIPSLPFSMDCASEHA